MSITKRFLILTFIFIALILGLVLMIILFSYRGSKNVSIKTSPQEVNYKIGGLEGQTPAKIKLESGKYQLELSKKGWESLSAQIEIKPFQKELSLSYTLKSVPGTGSNLSKNKIDKQMSDYKKRFPYANLLPVQTKDFYIEMPSDDGSITVYINRKDEASAKNIVYQWFKDHGEASPQTLNIKWLYSD